MAHLARVFSVLALVTVSACSTGDDARTVPDRTSSQGRAVHADAPTQPRPLAVPLPPVDTAPADASVARGSGVDGLVVAPDGRPDGNGSIERPYDLKTALARSSIPGRRILLRGGRYRGAFVSTISGTARRPLVVTSYPGEWAVLDGGSQRASTLDVQGRHVWFRDFEVTKSDPDRVSRHRTNKPPDVSRARWSGVWVEGEGTKLINLVVHDAGDGIGIWRRARSAEVYGCVLFNNGWIGADHPWGHGIYAQNAVGTKTIADNVVFNNFGWGLIAYDGLGPIVGFDIRGNTMFGNGSPAGLAYSNLLVGSENGMTDRISVRENIAYHAPSKDVVNVELGYPRLASQRTGSIIVDDNHFVGGNVGLSMDGWTSTDVTDNVIAARPMEKGSSVVAARFSPPGPAYVRGAAGYRWDHNRYSTPVGSGAFRLVANGTDRSMTFAEWRDATGFDPNAAHGTDPFGPHVEVRPDRYTRGRATITVLNTRGARSIEIDPSSTGLEMGERFEIRDVQNLAARPLLVGTYMGGRVRIPMRSASVQQPIGGPVAVKHTPNEFGVFLVRKVTAAR